MVVAVRDAAHVLPRCVESVLGQEAAPVDLVIIDGGSTDGTVALIESWSDRLGYWVSEPDRGVYHAWNKGIAHIRGDWVCFLGADDRFAGPDVLTRMAPHLAQRPERVVYGLVHVIDEEGQLKFAMGEPWPQTRAVLGQHMSLPNAATFYHRSLFEVHGGFDESFRIAGDYELLLRELRDHDAWFVSDVLVTIMGADGLSQRPGNRPLSLREASRALRMNGFPTPPDWRSFDLYEAYVYAWADRWLPRRVSGRLWATYQVVRRRLA